MADATGERRRHAVAKAGEWDLVASGQASWHGFASAIVEDAHALGLLARTPLVTPITTGDFPTPARRPANSVLDTTRLRSDFGIVPPDWRVGLRATLRDIASR